MGMAIGSIVGGLGLFAFGTKNGREKMRKLLDTFEDLDIEDVEEFLKKQAAKGQKGPHSSIGSDIHTVLDKIQSSIPGQEEMKKYFSKDGKILK